ncbi:MAG TPA: HD domain-containing protein, partial [Candidatus Eisenbacteria bacterium]|nr:HD domain-containing protein [Candidatus Eisenbacteria bacterium]
SPGEPAWAHAVHTCLVAVAVGRHLGLDRRGLSDAGVAALLHDVGQPLVAAGLGPDPARWTDAERARAARHTFAGVRRIAGSTTLNPTSLAAMRAALEHHLDAGAGRPVAALSRLVAIADAFTTLLARAGGDGPGLTPCDALAIVLGPLAERFDPALRAALVRAVGLYPPGQVVRLDDGALARALAPDPADPARPLLERLTGADGRVLPESRRTIAPLPPGRRIAAALPLAEWPAPPDAEAEAA